MHWYFATNTIQNVIICRELNDPTYYCIAAKRKYIYISNSDSPPQKLLMKTCQEHIHLLDHICLHECVYFIC